MNLNCLPWDLNLVLPDSSSTLVLNFSYPEVCVTAVSGEWVHRRENQCSREAPVSEYLQHCGQEARALS